MASSLRLYSIAGRTGVTAATTLHAAAGFWNPSASKILHVFEIWWTKTVATADDFGLIRITARGTPASTVTPTATSSWGTDPTAPPSGAILDIGAYSVQPAKDGTNFIKRINLAGSIGGGFIWMFDEGELEIAPSKGIAIIIPTAAGVVAIQPGDIDIKWGE